MTSSPASAAAPEEQRRALVTARRRATGLLAAVAVALVATVALPDGTGTDYLRAMLEAGLVGGLADWFAVVALFRHPLGVPIPHTAVIPKSKDGLGANLASFVEENFLDEGDLVDRLARPENVTTLGAWLADPANSGRLSGQVVGLVRAGLDTVDRDDVQRRVTGMVHARLLALPLPELAGRTLEGAVQDGRHQAAVTGVIDGVREAIGANRTVLRQRLGQQSPGWVPPIVDDLVFDRGEDVVVTFLRQLAADDTHELRRSLDEQLLALTRRMQHEPEMAARIDEAVASLVTVDLVSTWVGDVLDDLEARIAQAAQDPDDPVRSWAADAIRDLGTRLQDDDELRERVLDGLRSVAPTVAAVGQREISTLVSATVDRWDAAETSDRLELWMGRDLQFVRINGTVVGGLVGLLLHAGSTALGF